MPLSTCAVRTGRQRAASLAPTRILSSPRQLRQRSSAVAVMSGVAFAQTYIPTSPPAAQSLRQGFRTRGAPRARARFTSGGNKGQSRKSYVCDGQSLHFSELAVLRERPVANRGGLRPADRNGSGR